MKFNEEILKAWENYEREQANEITPPARMRNILSKKYPDKDFSNYGLFWLYKVEAELSFDSKVLVRFNRTWKYGFPKTCPIKKFIQSPTLF